MNNREITFFLNDRLVCTQKPAGSALIDFIRSDHHLTGTRIGCREGDCGACTVLLGRLEGWRVRYRSVASCLYPLADAAACHVITIEGLNRAELTPVQQVFVSEGASQCGFCTPGLVLSLTGFLLNSKTLSLEEALCAIEGNLCRCTGYMSIRRALDRLLLELRQRLEAAADRLLALIDLGVLPAYFTAMPPKLEDLTRRESEALSQGSALIVAGATDLAVQRGPELSGMELKFLSRQQELSSIWSDSKRIFIGAAVTVSDLMESDLLHRAWPSLRNALFLVSSEQIRNRATVGGNIVNASPIGDLSVILLALDATIGLRLHETLREMKLRDFFIAYKKTALGRSELLTWVSIPVRPEGALFHFEKVSRRRLQDIASVNSAMTLDMSGERIRIAHVSAGGVAAIPLYLEGVSKVISGQDVSVELVRNAMDQAEKEISPISDVRGSARYKRILLRRLLFAHFLELFPNRISAGDLS